MHFASLCTTATAANDYIKNHGASTNAELTEVYNDRNITSAYTDVKSGSCATHSAKAGYDLCTGVGVVKGKTDK